MNLLLYISFRPAVVDAGCCHLAAEIGLNKIHCFSLKLFPADKLLKEMLVLMTVKIIQLECFP